DQQASFVTATETVEVIHGLPEFVLSDRQVFDEFRSVHQNAVDHRLHAAAAFVVLEAAGFLEEVLHVLGVGNFYSHGSGLIFVIIVTGLTDRGMPGLERNQLSSSRIEDGWRHSGLTSISM